MSMKDVINEFDGEVQGEPLNVEIHSWKTEGEWIVGELKEIREFTESNFDNSCKQYILRTDDGLVSCVLGQSVDKQIETRLKIGAVLFIKYRGKLDLGDGRSVNRFAIIDVTEMYNKKRKHKESNKTSNMKPPDEQIPAEYYVRDEEKEVGE